MVLHKNPFSASQDWVKGHYILARSHNRVNHVVIYTSYAVVGVGEAKLPQKLLLAAAAAAASKRILGGLAALQPSLPTEDRISSVI